MIDVRGVTKTYKSLFKQVTVLRGVDLSIGRGEVVGLIGPNGAGKTTLMSCLLGYLRPDDGEIAIDGRRNDDLAIRRRTGFVPERLNFDRAATGREFLRYMGRLAGLAPAEANRRVESLMTRLGIAEAGNRKLSQYSRGMLQRTGLIQALIADPDFIFLDEPTSGLDPHGVLLVRDVIEEQKRRGATVLLNSHQLAEVEKVCDRVFFLSGGVVAQAETLRGAPTTAIAITLLGGSFDPLAVTNAAGVAPNDNMLTIEVTDDAAIAEAVRRIVATGAGVVDVRRQTADLEEMFRGAK